MSSIVASDKIFLDIDDEINFVVEKIKAAERDRVIVVVPQNALVVSSLVSLKILAKQIAKSKKNVILVTEDDFGRTIADKAGLKSVDKVSAITAEMWEAAQILKAQSLERMDQVKKQLLRDRGAIDAEEITDEETEELAEVEEIVETKSEPEIPPLPSVKPEEEVIEGPIKRKQIEPKLVKIGSFEILAGGDIADPGSSQKDAIIEGSKPETEHMTDEPAKKPSNKPDPRGGFTGKDWTSFTGRSSGKKPFGLGGGAAPGERAPLSGGRKLTKKRIAIIAVAIIALLLLGGGYVFAFQLSSAEVRLKLQTAEVPVDEIITASVDADEIDARNLIIPAQIVVEDELSISASNQATGTGNKGNKAAGLVDLWNKTNKDITLQRGTVLQNTTTNLKYVLNQNVTVPAAEFSSEGFSDVGQVQDVSIEAESFGPDYNITEAGTKVDFKVANHDTADLIGKRFRNIEGGTSEEFVAVSEKDVEEVAKTLERRLQQQGVRAIQDKIPSGFILIDGSEELTNVKITANPDVGEEAQEFSVSVTARMTAFIVRAEDLRSAIQILVENNESLNGEFEVDSLEDVIIDEVERNKDGSEVKFIANTSGSLRSRVTEDNVKNLIGGLNPQEAASVLDRMDQIIEFRIDFVPQFVPEALRLVPTDHSRIKVIFE